MYILITTSKFFKVIIATDVKINSATNDKDSTDHSRGKLIKDNILPWGFPGGSLVKSSPVNSGDVGVIPGQQDPLEKALATHSSILAWEIPWTEEPGRPQSTESQKSPT